MTTQPRAVRLELCEAPPPEAAVGSHIVLRIRVSCPAGRDRRGVPINVVAPDGGLCAFELATYDGKVNESADVTLEAPMHVGEHRWRIVLPAHEIAGVSHAEQSLPVVMRTRPHETSLAVWSVPSPVVTGAWFAIKVGAKSLSRGALAGRPIKVGDATGAVVASGALGDAPLACTEALYWTTLEVPAPRDREVADYAVWLVSEKNEAVPTHFSITVAAKPAYTLTVTVTERDTKAALDGVEIRVGSFRARTDKAGRAELRVSRGDFQLQLWRTAHIAEPQPIRVGRDDSLELTMVHVPEEHPDARWVR